MRTRRYIIFILFIYITTACTKEYDRHLVASKHVVVTSFPKHFNLDGHKLNLKLYGVEEVAIIDTFLLGFDIDGTDKFIKVYSTENYKYLGDIISQGRGPNELLTVLTQNQYYIDSAGCHLWITEETLFSKIYLLNITKSLTTGSTVFDTSFVLKHNPVAYKYYINDSIIIGFDYNKEKQITYVKYNMIQQKIISERNIFDKDFFNKEHRNAFAFDISNIKPDSLNKIAGASYSLNNIYVIDLELKNSLTINVEQKNRSIYDIIKDGNDLYTYHDIVVTNNYIFALYIDKTSKDIFSKETNSGVEVHVFKWDGKPVCKILIDENIWGISIDSNQNTLYGYTPFEDVYRYDLINILN